MTARLILMTKALFFSLMMPLSIHAEWEPLPSLPEPNGGFMCGTANNKIVIVGGTNWAGGTKNWLKSIRLFDPMTKAWGSVQNFDNPIAYGVNLQTGSQFAFLGGSDGKEPFRVFGMVDDVRSTVLKMPLLPNAVVLSAGGSIHQRHVFVGGTDDASNISAVTCQTHVIEYGKISRLADCPGKPFAVAASAVLGDELFVFGGMNYNESTKSPVNSTEAFAFEPAENAWRNLKRLDMPNRGLTAVTLDEQHIYLAGGYTDDFTSDAFIYDVKADSYRKAKSLPYAAMVGLVKHDGFVYCLGGEDKKQSRTDKFFRIQVAELLKP